MESGEAPATAKGVDQAGSGRLRGRHQCGSGEATALRLPRKTPHSRSEQEALPPHDYAREWRALRESNPRPSDS